MTADILATVVDITVHEMPETEQLVDVHVHSVMKIMPTSDGIMNDLKKETAKDPDMAILQNTIMTGWPQAKQDCASSVIPYWNEGAKL